MAPDPTASYFTLDHVLFLDFDGVLHTDGCEEAELFCFMPEFCAVMREVDPLGHLPIVISSMWRLDGTLPALRAHFPPDIARQIVGVTPELHERDAQPAAFGWALSGQRLGGVRQRECQIWMQTYAPAGQWLAIDDQASCFDPQCPQLFVVPSVRFGRAQGLSAPVARQLKAWLYAALDQAPGPAAPGPSP